VRKALPRWRSASWKTPGQRPDRNTCTLHARPGSSASRSPLEHLSGALQCPPPPSRARSDCPERAFPAPIGSSHRRRGSARRSQRPYSRVQRGRRMMESEFRTPTRCSIPTRPESNGGSRRRVSSRVASARRPLQTPQPVHQRLILICGLEDFLGEVDGNLERKHRDPTCGCGPTHGELVPRTAPETLS
jgi:hypothetical protein